MQMDIGRYRHFVDRFDWPEEQKVAALTHVWQMMESFVDRAFGTAPEQQLTLGGMGAQRGISGAKGIEALPSDPEIALNSAHPLTPIFNSAARPAGPARKRRR